MNVVAGGGAEVVVSSALLASDVTVSPPTSATAVTVKVYVVSGERPVAV